MKLWLVTRQLLQLMESIPEAGDCGLGLETALEEGIKKLFKDEVLKSKLADKGYERVVRFLNWDNVASEVTKV